MATVTAVICDGEAYLAPSDLDSPHKIGTLVRLRPVTHYEVVVL